MTKSLEIYRSTRTTVIKAGRVSSHRGSLPFLRYLHKFHPQYLSAFDEKAIQGEELYQKLMLDKLEVNAGMLVENSSNFKARSILLLSFLCICRLCTNSL